MTIKIEKDWTTKAGLRAVCVMQDMGFRCGYVGVPFGHPLYGIGYSEPVPGLIAAEQANEVTLGMKSPLLLLTATVNGAGSIRRSLDILIDCHGGLTYSGNGRAHDYPVPSDLWWFGFDCGHAGDGSVGRVREFLDGPVRSTEYVVENCESVADQFTRLFEETKNEV